ncbi:phosphotransferase (plasmid) [Deinococcus sp. KNUC1210]|uniref:phosphotransferase n=1 Tax=Deinococcus sp. KNUC1210 TaxID=2917691 RepID=UPI001EF057BA|nr:phosphotransferase [Deinococcus sp. KNUC1210]ULH16957.1 phosphotransferase [Deinococcus sp. KNUC1210]
MQHLSGRRDAARTPVDFVLRQGVQHQPHHLLDGFNMKGSPVKHQARVGSVVPGRLDEGEGRLSVMQPVDLRGPKLLNQLGFDHADLLASGMEGEVYRVGEQRVAKIWKMQTAPQLQHRQLFYDDLALFDLGFGTPQIEQVLVHDSQLVSIEREWQGKTLQHWLNPDDTRLPDERLKTFIEILSVLKNVRATPAMYHMPVLDEAQAFWTGATSFQEELLLLLERRVHRFGQFWHSEIQDFAGKYLALQQQLRTLPGLPDTVLHGDLFGGNVLLLPGGQLSAVLDFGVFATAGDARFDAAICGAVVNMYGPHAPIVMREVTGILAKTLGYDLQVLRLYQAAYALATSHLYSLDGLDGHFRWCIQQWQKPDILEAF